MLSLILQIYPLFTHFTLEVKQIGRNARLYPKLRSEPKRVLRREYSFLYIKNIPFSMRDMINPLNPSIISEQRIDIFHLPPIISMACCRGHIAVRGQF